MAITGEKFEEKRTRIGREARLNVSAVGCWITGQRVFCDIRVFYHNAQRYENTEIKKIKMRIEDENMKNYNSRVLGVENESLVLSVNGGMGEEARFFYQISRNDGRK